jgi:alpha-ketoglutarate-dependent taurine dioxygenase
MTENAAPGVIRRRAKVRAVVSVHPEWDGRALPALVRAAVPGVDLPSWIADHRATLDELVYAAGAVLLRAFAVDTAAGFAAVMNALSPAVLEYSERSSPRSEVAPGIYTSTDHPADQSIALHNEQSYTLDWPMRIAFCCVTPPGQDGRTPLADSRRVLARLEPRTLARFERDGVLYVRNYLPGISLPWREAFGSGRRADVEAFCAERQIACEWLDGDRLRTRQVRPAVHVHPHTGERTWFNHALFFHVTSLPGDIAAGLRAALPPGDLPYNTFYGDGAPFEDAVLAQLRAAYAAQTLAFDWRAGDVLVIENMLTAHGREPFAGPRRILAAMADPRSRAAVTR